ncbi:MAG TPA: endonuclease [Pyrinomonadaceae bacterium]|nr:endonuclease [Pyrinomonadaceae bacterium]
MENNFETEGAAFFAAIPEFQEAIAEFQAAAERPYYDEEADGAARGEYYRAVQSTVDLNARDFYQSLNRLLTETHTGRKSYKPAVHLYPWVDLHDGGSERRLKSIYSGRDFDPREFIAADFRIERQREQLRSMLASNAEGFSMIDAERQFNLLEAAMPFNCEHVVPQSWFRKKEPMRGDLHHLFACEISCNSFRGNIPFFDFTDFGDATEEECGKRRENKFEPAGGKGAVARETLYFLLRYPGEINRTSKEYTEDRIQTILGWHRNHPVTRYEKHRNAAIQEKQGNRNPLIDFPEWAERIDFLQGLG